MKVTYLGPSPARKFEIAPNVFVTLKRGEPGEVPDQFVPAMVEAGVVEAPGVTSTAPKDPAPAPDDE